MTRIRIGCTGWGYDEWRGAFYPVGTPPGEYLERYARVFDLVEVDSTYYQAPDAARVARWAASTPPGFAFALKFPGAVTHEGALRGVGPATESFLASLQPLRKAGKMGPLVLQLPARFVRGRDEDALEAFLDLVPRDQRLAVELRHPSWWTPETYRLLGARDAALVWSVTGYGRAPPVPTADWGYLRLIGDRALTRFGSIQRDQTAELRLWADRLKDEGSSWREAFVLLNNHLMGFAPQTASLMARTLGLPTTPDLQAAQRPKGQTRLF